MSAPRSLDDIMALASDPEWIAAHSVSDDAIAENLTIVRPVPTAADLLSDMRVPPMFHGVDAADRIPERGVIYTGLPGVGKTHRATSEALAIAATGKRVLWLSLPVYTTSIRTREPVPSLDTLRRLDAIVLDDIAFTKSPEWMRDALYTLLGTLLDNHVFTIGTSNCDRVEIARRYGDPLASRLAGLCPDTVPMAGRDRRLFEGGSK